MDKLQEILADTAAYIEWQQEEGEKTAEVDPAILRELSIMSETGNATISRTHAGNTPTCSSPKYTSSQKSVVPETTVPKVGSKSAKEAPQQGSDRANQLQILAKEIQSCDKCPLHKGRIQAVPGQGNPNPEILFIGEAPGADEDEQGLAFVGRAGKLLTKMIEAMGFTREEVFIANVNKCRPPNNRKPSREEMDACLPYVREQVAILQPKVIVALGATAVEGLVPESAKQRISALRGNWLSFENIPVMPTYHPAYLLRSPKMKKPVWEDLQAVLRHLGRPIPGRSTSQ